MMQEACEHRHAGNISIAVQENRKFIILFNIYTEMVKEVAEL